MKSFQSDRRATEALRIIERLQSSGYVAYLAGGCVRDQLLGRVAKDFDVATDATPATVRELFGKRNTLAFGAAFGV
ncbi:MAG: CCA tRNA nucleotidyltransferase, partial [Planctomycetota bacterium]